MRRMQTAYLGTGERTRFRRSVRRDSEAPRAPLEREKEGAVKCKAFYSALRAYRPGMNFTG
jgi:hypothetical protein